MFDFHVIGVFSGSVKAKNKKEAEKIFSHSFRHKSENITDVIPYNACSNKNNQYSFPLGSACFFDKINSKRLGIMEVNDLLNSKSNEIRKLEFIKERYKEERDYLLFVLERNCPKELVEEIKNDMWKIE